MKTISFEIKVEGIDKTINSIEELDDVIKGLKDDLSKSEVGSDKFNKLTDSIKKAEDEAKKLKQKLNDTGEAAKKAGDDKGVKGLTGSLLKAGSVAGLLMSALEFVKNALMGNQEVADTFNAVIATGEQLVREFFTFIVDNSKVVVDFFKQIFEDPQQAIADLGTAIKNNIIERFNSLIEAVGFAGSAIVELFKGNFDEAAKLASEAGKELIDVATGVDDTYGKVGEVLEKVADRATKLYDANKKLIQSQNEAEISAARQAGITAKLEAEAEKLRQQRDDETNSIADRIKANEDLAKKLDELAVSQRASAQLEIAAAQQALALNKTKENRIALINAQNKLAEIENQIEGQRSEQLQNRMNLEKELIMLSITKKAADEQLIITQQEFNNSLIKNTQERLAAEKQLLEDTRATELARLQENIDLYKEGTQARLDAEIAYNEKKQELDNELVTKDNEIKAASLARSIELRQMEITQQLEGKDEKLALLDLEYEQKFAAAQGDAEKLVLLEAEKQEKIRQLNNETFQKNADLAKQGLEATQALTDVFFAAKMKKAKGNAKEEEKLAKRQFQINKAMQLAGAGIDLAKGISASLASAPVAIGPAPNPAGIASLAFVTATGLAQIAKIAATKFEAPASSTAPTPPSAGGGGGGDTGGGPAAAIATAFQGDIFGQVSTGAQQGQTLTPGEGGAGQIRAYVTESDITSTQNRVNKYKNLSEL